MRPSSTVALAVAGLVAALAALFMLPSHTIQISVEPTPAKIPAPATTVKASGSTRPVGGFVYSVDVGAVQKLLDEGWTVDHYENSITEGKARLVIILSPPPFVRK